MSDVDKNYVQRYVEQAKSTENQAVKNDCLYRCGTQLEVIPCNGDSNLTPEQQQTVLDASDKLLNE